MNKTIIIMSLIALPALHGCPFCDHMQPSSTIPFFIEQENAEKLDMEVSGD